MSAEARLESLNLELPPAPKPAGVYKPALIIGTTCYVSGHGPLRSDATLITGRVDEQALIDAVKQAGYAAELAG